MVSANEEEVRIYNLIAAYNYLKESYRDDGAKFFSPQYQFLEL